MDKIITIDDYLTVKTSIYDVIKSYTVFYTNKYEDIRERRNTYGFDHYQRTTYAEEKGNDARFLFHNDAEKNIFINNIIHNNDERFLFLVNEAQEYDVLYNFIYEINKLNRCEDDKKRKTLINWYKETYLKKHKKTFENLKETFCTYRLDKKEYNLLNIINKFTEICVFNQPLINKINGYEEEKVYTK